MDILKNWKWKKNFSLQVLMKGKMPNTENFGKNDAKARSYVIEKLSTCVLNRVRSCATALEMIEKLDSQNQKLVKMHSAVNSFPCTTIRK